MIIVGFTNKTSKLLPRIFCRRYRHCAPIITCPDGKMIMYQFIRRGCVATLTIRMRDIRLLRRHGWTFVCIPNANKNYFRHAQHWTCVEMTCDAIGMRNMHPITPWALYKKITAERRDFFI